ncbi:MAG: hypothetical protein AAF806_21810 [Bacteroidota bacterium]
MSMEGCCYMPLVKCEPVIKPALDIPKVLTDSIFNIENTGKQYTINSALAEKKRKKEYILVVIINHDKDSILSYSNSNFYFMNGKKIYSNQVISFDPVNGIPKNKIQVRFDFSRDILESIIKETSLFVTEIINYNGKDTVKTEIPYHLEFNSDVLDIPYP